MNTETTLEQQANDARDALAHDLDELQSTAKDAGPAIERAASGLVPAMIALGIGVVGAALTTKRTGRLVRDVILGAVAGLPAGFAMSELHAAWGAAQRRFGGAEERNEKEGGVASDEPATVKAAEAVAGPIAGDAKSTAGTLMHYVMAAGTGAIYGALSDVLPVATVGRGVPFGAAVWLGADETIVPALGLSRPPWEYPANVHVRAIAAHLLYGAVLDGVLRFAKRMLS
jgi:hypothetical protein